MKTRGVNDILIAVTDGLKGMPEALGAVFPATTLQTCIVHLIRSSLELCKLEGQQAAGSSNQADLHRIQCRGRAGQAGCVWARRPWGIKFPTVVAAWRRDWDKVDPFYEFPPEVRKVIYTSNAIESVNARLSTIIKTRGHFPSDDAAAKLIWLALRNSTADWGSTSNHRKTAMNQFAILYEDRFTQPAQGGPNDKRLNHECMSQPGSPQRSGSGLKTVPTTIRQLKKPRHTQNF